MNKITAQECATSKLSSSMDEWQCKEQTQQNKNDSKKSMLFLTSNLYHKGKNIKMHLLCKCVCPNNNCKLSSEMLHISGDEYSTNRLCSYCNSDS